MIAAKPDHAEAHYTLWKALLQQQAVSEAIRELKAALALDAAKPYMGHDGAGTELYQFAVAKLSTDPNL